jgi:hypothetical protein
VLLGPGGAAGKEAILDGEVVALDSEGRQNFRDLIAGRGNLHYAAFDALWVNGKDLRGLGSRAESRPLRVSSLRLRPSCLRCSRLRSADGVSMQRRSGST